MSQINLVATIQVPGEQLAEAWALMRDYREVVHAEPGNLRFEIYVTAERDAIVVVERYRSADAFDRHLSTAANAEVNAQMVQLLGAGGVLQMLEDFD